MEHKQRETEAALLQEIEDLSAERDSGMASQEKGNTDPDYQQVLQKLDQKTAELKNHQTALELFHTKTHSLQEELKARQEEKLTGSSLLSQKEEVQTQAVAQEESGKRLMIAAEANE